MVLWLLLLSVSVLAILGISFAARKTHESLKYKNHIPGPAGLPFLGVALDFLSNDSNAIFRTVLKLVDDWSGLVRVNLAHHKIVLTAIPEDIEVIMTDQRFLEKSIEYDMLRPWLKDGLLTVGDKGKWQQRRKVLTPAFHFKILEDFVETMDQQAHMLTKVLAQKHGDNLPFDVCPYITLYTLDVICETSMGVTVNAQTAKESPYVNAVMEISAIIFWRLHHFLGRDEWFWNLTSQRRRHDVLVKQIHAFTAQVIEDRRKVKDEARLKAEVQIEQEHHEDLGIKKRRALLDILLESSMDGRTLSNDDIQEEVDNFMFAGHDTTTSAIEFLLFNLAKYPEVQQRVYDEVVHVLGSDPTTPATLSMLNDLNYLELVIKESLRLFPSVPIIGRYIKEDIEVNGKVYPANHNILMFMYYMHRNPKYFDDPLAFKPERFMEQRSHSKLNTFSYTPFSGGYRNCIGQKFAQYEIKTVISRLLQTFEVSLGKEDFEPLLGVEIILRPLNGISLRLKKRQS